jgi:hypothetical protein
VEKSTFATDGTADAQPTVVPIGTPYSGPTPIHVSYASSSCQNMATSPYPYLDLDNTSPTESLYWRIEVSNPAYTLWKGDEIPNPSGPLISMFVDFVGPSVAPGPLGVSIYTNMGNWQGRLQPCSVEKPPTQTPFTPATPPPPPTYIPFPVTFTCAEAVANGPARLCIHTLPNANVSLGVGYCSGNGESSLGAYGSQLTDANGNFTWTWTAHTDCRGTATAEVVGSKFDPTLGNWYRGTVDTTFTVQ